MNELTITALNDFVFCPASVYYHGLYGVIEKEQYYSLDQVRGKSAHKTVDEDVYSTRKSVLTGIDVYSEKYGLCGKIDIYDSGTKCLIERKRKIKTLYDGYVFQMYGEYFGMLELGYKVEKMLLHSLEDNRNYAVPLPDENPDMLRKFEQVIYDINHFELESFRQTNEEKQILIVNLHAGEKISFTNDNIRISDADGKTKHESTCYRIFALFVIGNVTITNVFLERAKKFGFSIIFMNGNLRVQTVLMNGASGNTLLHRKQYEYQGIEIGKRIIANKIETERDVIKKMHSDMKKQESIFLLEKYMAELTSGKWEFDEVLSIEGNCARIYFKTLYSEFEWHGRKPRTKCDMINTLLDIGYTVLFNYVDAILNLYDFDEYIGVFHREFYKRKSLVCDIMEPFQYMIDCQTIKSLHLKQFDSDDFQILNNRYCLRIQKSAKYSAIYAKCINDHKEEIFMYVRAYYRAFVKGENIESFPWHKV